MQTKGHIIWNDGTPVLGYTVELWDQDWVDPNDKVGTTKTDSMGNYTFTHERKQDPAIYFGRKKGDFFIRVFRPVSASEMEKVYESRTYKDCEADPLVIDVVLDKMMVEHGKNTVYGRVTKKMPNGDIRPFAGVRVKALDYDPTILNPDDYLGLATTDQDGNYLLTFSDAYMGSYDTLPDIYVEILEQEQTLEGNWKKIWQTGCLNNVQPPAKIDIEVPVIHVTGRVVAYETCENEVTVYKPLNRLHYYIYDEDDFLRLTNDLLADGSLGIDVDTQYGYINAYLIGNQDYRWGTSAGSDIYVCLKDGNELVWDSTTTDNVGTARGIDVGQNIVAGNPCQGLSIHTHSVQLRADGQYEGIRGWYAVFPLGQPRQGQYLTKLSIPNLRIGESLIVKFWCPARQQFDIRVSQNTSMTEQQLRDAFGSVNPALPVVMLAEVESSNPSAVTTIWVNLEYMGYD